MSLTIPPRSRSYGPADPYLDQIVRAVNALARQGVSFDLPLTNKGDLLTRNTTGLVRLAVGTDGMPLVASSGESKGMAWEALDLAGDAVTGILPAAKVDPAVSAVTLAEVSASGASAADHTYTMDAATPVVIETSAAADILTVDDAGVRVQGAQSSVTQNGTARDVAFSILGHDDDDVVAGVMKFSDTAGRAPDWNLYRARGTKASPAVVQSGDVLGRITCFMHDGTDWQAVANIAFKTYGTPGNNDAGGQIDISTVPDGGTSGVSRITIDESGINVWAADKLLVNSIPVSIRVEDRTAISALDVANDLFGMGDDSAGIDGQMTVDAATTAMHPTAKALRTSNQSIAQNTATAVNFSTVTNWESVSTMHDTVTNPSRITVPIAGKYRISAYAKISTANASNTFSMYLDLNGSGAGAAFQVTMPLDSQNSVRVGNITDVYNLAASGYVELYVYYNIAGPLNMTTAAIMLERIGP